MIGPMALNGAKTVELVAYTAVIVLIWKGKIGQQSPTLFLIWSKFYHYVMAASSFSSGTITVSD